MLTLGAQSACSTAWRWLAIHEARDGMPRATSTPAERRVAVDEVWGAGPADGREARDLRQVLELCRREVRRVSRHDVDWRALRDPIDPRSPLVSAGGASPRSSTRCRWPCGTATRFRSICLSMLDASRAWRAAFGRQRVDLRHVWRLPDRPGRWLGARLRRRVAAPRWGCSAAIASSATTGRPGAISTSSSSTRSCRCGRCGGAAGRRLRAHVRHVGRANWHLFDTMDVFKQATKPWSHVPTSLMPGVVWSPFCSEQTSGGRRAEPANLFGNDFVRSGVVTAPTSATSTSGVGSIRPRRLRGRGCDLTQVRTSTASSSISASTPAALSEPRSPALPPFPPPGSGLRDGRSHAPR